MKAFTFIILILVTGPLVSQNQDELLWSYDDTLTWSDFQEDAPLDSASDDACTVARIVFEMNYYPDSAVVVVQSIFDRNQSWVRDTCKNHHLLQHEQLHFDIVELYARKLRKELYEGGFSFTNIAYAAHVLFDQMDTQKDGVQALYDELTNHSLIVKEQEQWNTQIQKELVALEQFASPQVVIYY